MKKWKWGKMVSSNLFDNLWKIQIRPGGHDAARKDFVAIYIEICNFPPFVISIKANWKITCDQTNDIYTNTRDFSIDNDSYGIPQLMPTSKFRSLTGLSFTLNISILEVKFENDKNKLLDIIYDQNEISKFLSGREIVTLFNGSHKTNCVLFYEILTTTAFIPQTCLRATYLLK